MKATIRLIFDKSRPAALNMAVDEVLMAGQELPGAAPALRFYSWSSPACTVGYFQDVARVAAAVGRRAGVPVVRRLTGGGLVLHDKDLTFSLALPNPSPLFPADVKASYLKVNMALVRGLCALHPALDFSPCKDAPSRRGRDRVCFEDPSCYDLMLGKLKVVGASQRRKGGAVLHQSTVFLPDAHEALAARIVEGFRTEWGVEFEERPLTAAELDAAEAIRRERYARPEWASAGERG